MVISAKSFVNKVFRDKSGHIVIWQNPNLPLWLWIVSVIFGLMIKNGLWHEVASRLGTAAIFTWSYLEIRSGVNLFRRIIGIVVMLVIIYGMFRVG